MAMGGSPTIGLIAYTSIKLIGYSFAGKKLNQWYKVSWPRSFVFGVVRTILGVVVGISVLFLLDKVDSAIGNRFLLFLIPVRFFEWYVIIYFFYERHNYSFRRIAGRCFSGILWSFALDIPAIAAVFVIPGGVWVC
ncbi:MAG: hypothetical protein JST75_14235 [Bacteroidetes bacterium]|nr:hypothetical protein [Bacteroidota bacterium]